MTRPPIIGGVPLHRPPVVAGAVPGPGVTAGPGIVILPGTGAAGSYLDDLADVETTDVPAEVPLVLRKGADGVYRPEPAIAAPAWGDAVRFGPGAPDDLDAPLGAVHVDTANRRIYQLRSSST